MGGRAGVFSLPLGEAGIAGFDLWQLSINTPEQPLPAETTAGNSNESH